MKSLAELAAIREKMQSKVVIREGMSATRVVVGMATCGIAAGARPVLNAFVDGVNANGLNDKVAVTQTGCIGICQYEPVVEVYEEGKEKDRERDAYLSNLGITVVRYTNLDIHERFAAVCADILRRLNTSSDSLREPPSPQGEGMD